MAFVNPELPPGSVVIGVPNVEIAPYVVYVKNMYDESC